MARTKQIFGFGSLINTASLLGTAPNASDIRPAFVKGFKRDFSVWASNGSINLIPANAPFCALDIQKCSDTQAKVNGICFTVSEHDYKQLAERECEYKPASVTAYDFVTGKEIGECTLFSAYKDNGSYDFGAPAQTGYLAVCTQGAKSYGNKFYQEFLDTTYIGDKRLSEMPEFTKL